MTPALQLGVVAALVGISALSLLQRLAPRASWQVQARISYWLERSGRPAWLQRIGGWLRPSLAVTTSACGTGCSACKACK